MTALSEANCEEKVRAARAKVPDQGVKPDECFPACQSNVQKEVMEMVTNHIIPDVAKYLCTGCGSINPFIGNPLQQCNSCDNSFRVSISKLIGVSALAILCTAERGRKIPAYSTDSYEVKFEWMTQLLSSIITLHIGQNDPHLETLTTGGQADCTILTILRSLSNEQLEELRPDAEGLYCGYLSWTIINPLG